jgi:hypothetical protein
LLRPQGATDAFAKPSLVAKLFLAWTCRWPVPVMAMLVMVKRAGLHIARITQVHRSTPDNRHTQQKCPGNGLKESPATQAAHLVAPSSDQLFASQLMPEHFKYVMDR